MKLLLGREVRSTTVGTTGLRSDTKGVTAKVYTQLLEDSLIPACRAIMGSRYGSQWIFQHDNARAHTAKSTKAWLGSQSFTLV